MGLIGAVWLRFFGWQVEGGPPPVPKAVVVAVPHTSNWDLPFTLAVAWYLGLHIRWVGKKSLFKPLTRRFFLWLGGLPVDRARRSNAVQAIAAEFARHDELLLIVAPEGTRSSVGGWKSGFYWIAVEAGVPIVLGYLDYTRRRGGLGTLFEPTGDLPVDFEQVKGFYADKQGRHPDKQTALKLAD